MPDYSFDQIVLFQDLTAEQQALLKPLFFACTCQAGEVIFEQGDPAVNLYLLLVGEIIVRFKPEDGPALIVARVRPGNVVGWSAALGSPNYTSSAVCVEDCLMLCVRSQDLRELCQQYPETGALVLERLAVLIAVRLRNTYDHVITLLEQGLLAGLREP